MADTYDLLTLGEGYLAVNDRTNWQAVGGTAGDGSGSIGSRDDEMGSWITGVSRRIDELCGYVVQRTVTDELHDGGVPVIRPKHTPVVSVTTVVEYAETVGTTLTAETNASKPTSAYLLYDDGHNAKVVRRSGNRDARFAAGRRNVALTYEAGRYADTASVDEKFKLAAQNIIRRLARREGAAWGAPINPFDGTDLEARAFFLAMSKSVVHEFLAFELLPAM